MELMRIRELRRKRNMTLQDLAFEVTDRLSKEVSSVSMTYYEAGKRDPKLETLMAIADVFGVTTDYLLGRSNIVHSKDLSMEIRVVQRGNGYVLINGKNEVYTVVGSWRKTNQDGVLTFSTRKQADGTRKRLMANE
ncbi:XRE family transcriptional regulator [Weissella muntiaci]|uniref:XRE family transcriptional regulator n=1 Tax=Weissella muntiaci TaxID=2508881 RepID=A0A6C2CCH1_9LACO|nr:helix-turn-helix transcriptional regulator [Weissella muntiaci]TYC50865.1 XRE family transcriptional regulator [Weissella muntiaci]